MELNKLSFGDWVIAGIGFGIGMGVVSAIAGALMYWAMQYQLSQVGKQLLGVQDKTVRHLNESIKNNNIRIPQTVTIPPKSREECLGLTNGVANEQYQDCRNGYTTTR